jgi:predicted nucleic acid-binding protein
MRVVDTSIWIEIYAGTPLGLSLQSAVSDPAQVIVPTIVQHEIYKWLARERSVDDAIKAITYTGTCDVKDFTTAVAVYAAELAKTHKLHTTASIIYATALMNEATLLCSDAHFEGLEGVDYRLKSQ